ncbi:MAG: hypothetical protein ACRDB6_02745 [Cetobacterium sp.]
MRGDQTQVIPAMLAWIFNVLLTGVFRAIQPKFWINYIIAMLIAFIVPIIATYVLNKSNLIKNKK